MRLLTRSMIMALFVSLIAVSSVYAQRTPLRPGASCYLCFSCTTQLPNCEPPLYCDVPGHWVGSGPAPEGWTDPHEQCVSGGGCGGDHDTCPGGMASLSPEQQEELQTLVYLAVLGNTEAVATIMTDFAALASIRPEDQSLLIASACATEPGVYSYAVGLTDEQYLLAMMGLSTS